MTGGIDTSKGFDGHGVRVAIVAARWNASIVDRLVEGAQKALAAAGSDAVTVVRCPGAFELPSVARRLVDARKHDAIICFGCVIRGDTAHFDFVAGECARGIAELGLQGEVPVIFGVLTTENVAQAEQRADLARDNKGAEAAAAALEMVSIYRGIGARVA